MNTWPAPIDHAYILCSETYEPERYEKLKKWLDEHKMDPSCYTICYFKHSSDLTADEAFKAYNPWGDRPKVDGEEKQFARYNMKLSEISLCINWGFTAMTAVKKNHPSAVLLLESDPVFEDGFLEKLGVSMKKLDGKEWDYLSIGDGVGLRPQRPTGDSNRDWFPSVKPYYHTRTTVGQIVKVSMLKKVVSTFFPFKEPLDWELNYQLTRHAAKSLWLDPILIKNGSVMSETTTSL